MLWKVKSFLRVTSFRLPLMEENCPGRKNVLRGRKGNCANSKKLETLNYWSVCRGIPATFAPGWSFIISTAFLRCFLYFLAQTLYVFLFILWSVAGLSNFNFLLDTNNNFIFFIQKITKNNKKWKITKNYLKKW